MGITELQERVDVPAQIAISIQQVAQQAVNEDGQKILEVFLQEGEELRIASWARWEAPRKGLVDLERRCDMSREIQMLNKRQEKFQNAIEGKLRVQDRASEILQDQIIEEIKELESTKKEEALQKRRKSVTCGCTKMRKKQQCCRAPGNGGRMRKLLGKKYDEMT